jgi:hypothetical protein
MWEKEAALIIVILSAKIVWPIARGSPVLRPFSTTIRLFLRESEGNSLYPTRDPRAEMIRKCSPWSAASVKRFGPAFLRTWHLDIRPRRSNGKCTCERPARHDVIGALDAAPEPADRDPRAAALRWD